nr:McrC family protein [Vibrio coralliilyticus]
MRAEAVTGVIRIGNTDIEIAPKFLSFEGGNWQAVLWQILLVVEGGYVDDKLTTAHYQASLSISDLLAEMFLASYSKGAVRGLPRSYSSEHSEGVVLRGQLDTSRLGEWIARPWRLPYIADTLNEDTNLARLLRWSANCLATTVKSPSRARALREIAANLSHVGKRPPHLFDAMEISLGPQHQGLDPARIVGVLLLEGSGVDHAVGEYSLSGFLWNSDTIYENYIFWLCRRAASLCGHRVSKEDVKFGEVFQGKGSRLTTTPDVVFHDSNGAPFAVTDAKYKRLGTRPKASDTYQVLTAGHVLGCQRVSLTYPVSTNREPTIWRVPSALGARDMELTALPINLMKLTMPGGQHVLIDSIRKWLDRDIFFTD